LPFLRVIRDKRGYETTYLMHWFNEGGRPRSRVLYAFRGPAMARVGRVPLDPATMRHLEAAFPDVSFDWATVNAEKQVIEAAPEVRRRRPRREESPPPQRAEPAAETPALPAAAPAPTPDRPRAVPSSLPTGSDVERVAFLTEWYPLVRERVERRTTDEVRRQALLTLAERLNPAAWGEAGATADHFTAAEESLERLARVLTRRRRRSHMRSGASQTPS
jgi:hypothetical protein